VASKYGVRGFVFVSSPTLIHWPPEMTGWPRSASIHFWSRSGRGFACLWTNSAEDRTGCLRSKHSRGASGWELWESPGLQSCAVICAGQSAKRPQSLFGAEQGNLQGAWGLTLAHFSYDAAMRLPRRLIVQLVGLDRLSGPDRQTVCCIAVGRRGPDRLAKRHSNTCCAD